MRADGEGICGVVVGEVVVVVECKEGLWERVTVVAVLEGEDVVS